MLELDASDGDGFVSIEEFMRHFKMELRRHHAGLAHQQAVCWS